MEKPTGDVLREVSLQPSDELSSLVMVNCLELIPPFHALAKMMLS